MFHCDTVGKEESRKEERNLIIFTDSGDTLIDEGSEVRKEEGGVVYAAEFIPGAEETLRELKARGYRMVPETEEETPEYRIEEPLQLLELVERLENMV